MAVIGLALMVLVGGLFKLQVLDHRELEEQSKNNRIRVVPIPPRRGNVYDRDGRVVIDNRPSYTVSVVPAEEVKGVTLANLAGVIDLDTLQIRKRIRKNLVSRYQPASVKRDIPFEVVAILEEQSERFPGVTYQMERVRQYVDSLGIESFTGYVGEVSEDELSGEARDYRPGSMIGKKGLERQYDADLRGREGTAYIEVTASGQILGAYEGREELASVPGADLTLSIDLDLQRVGIEALDTSAAAIVAMDPRNGEILAMISHPGYDPNIFSSVIPESTWTRITTDPHHPLLNRPLSGLYPPGSTTKLITVGAGMMEGAISENTTLGSCTGGYLFGNRVFHCWDLGGHGRLTAAHALEQSCDIYMYQLGLKLGIDKLSEYYHKSGFGMVTGVDLPGEARGNNPSTAYYDQHFGKNKWTLGLVLNNSIGQGEILVTPLQLAQYYCGHANGGVIYRPHLVKSISHPDGRRESTSPEEVLKLPYNSRVMELLDEGIRLVVEGEHGTARRLRNDHYSIGGKTGTAQNPHGDEHALFVGVAPLEEPEIVVCAILENAGHGSEAAAPVVGKVIKAYMEKNHPLDTLVIAPVETVTPVETVAPAETVTPAETATPVETATEDLP